MTTSQLSHLNNRLARDLGRNPHGEPLMAWKWSESLLHPVRVPGFDFKPDRSGLVVAHPRYETRPMNPAFSHQWVICRWEAPIPESEWREAFGTEMEWPNRGEYYPTNVSLPRGEEPSLTWTERVVQAEGERRRKSLADHLAEIQRDSDALEQSARSRRSDIISDALTAFGNCPGKKLHVSLPGVGIANTQ